MIKGTVIRILLTASAWVALHNHYTAGFHERQAYDKGDTDTVDYPDDGDSGIAHDYPEGGYHPDKDSSRPEAEHETVAFFSERIKAQTFAKKNLTTSNKYAILFRGFLPSCPIES